MRRWKRVRNEQTKISNTNISPKNKFNMDI
jgi:hypothetical protein